MNKFLLFFFFGLTFFFANAQNEFITTWKTDNQGLSEDNQVTIPTFFGENYNYTVEWGDGSSDTGVTGDITHTYANPGTYTVVISGMFPRIYFNATSFSIVGDEQKFLSVEQWGTNLWTSMESAFAGCRYLNVNAQDIPNLTNVTSLRRMFFLAGYWPFSISRIEDWDISNITDLSGMFDKSNFNQDLSNWNVSNVTDMSYLFFSCPFNQDVSGWDVSKVTNMEGLFGSGGFKQDVTGWDVSSVTNMAFMFNSTFFDQDISSWDVSKVTNMRHMLSQCSFNQDISSWNIGQVTDLSNIFDDNDLSRENYDKILIGWSQLPSLRFGVQLGAKDVIYCSGKDARASLISNYGWNINDQGENCEADRPFITTWKTDNPGFSQNNQITIPTNPREVYNYDVDWGDGTSNTGITEDITHTYAEPGTYQVSISGRFPHIYFNSSPDGHHQGPAKNADAEKILSIDQWGTNRWLSLSFAFAGCSNLDVKATDNPNFSKDIFISAMFLNCTSLIGNASMSNWDLSDITFSAHHMFSGASKFNQNIGNWDVDKIRYMDNMFKGATDFDQNLENWDIGKAENLDNIFDDSALSTGNYDKILNAWSGLPTVLNGVKFGANNTAYCEGATARQNLIDNYGWVIEDNGENANCNIDNDNDGVFDHLDDCLNTPDGTIVNETGCLDLFANGDIFTIEGIGEACPDADNAKISIAASEMYDYVATINGTDYTFTNDLTIEDLSPGTYDLCINVASESFQQCFILELAEASNVSGKSTVENGKISFKIDKGTAPYNVQINGRSVLRTSSKEFSLNVQQGDLVELATDKVCEGVMAEKVEVAGAWRAYPNPTNGSFEIELPILDEHVIIDIFSSDSQLISTDSYPVLEGKVKLNIDKFSKGIYFTKIYLKEPITLKIVKQ